MDLSNYKDLATNISNTLKITDKQICQDIQNAIETYLLNIFIQQAAELHLKNSDWPENDDVVVNFGYPDINFSFSLTTTDVLNPNEPYSFKNNLMYNAVNNMDLALLHQYMNVTRVEVPLDKKGFQRFSKLVEKRIDFENGVIATDASMTKCEALEFIMKYTAYNKYIKFFTTRNFEMDDDI